MADSMFDGKAPKSPRLVTTPRVDTLGPQSPSDWEVADSVPPVVPVEDRGTRSESDGNPTIWAGYRNGY